MISGIRLVNFRNYDNCLIDFAPGLNCISGANGQGKTNILEGVYYLSLLRSFRTSNVNELRQWKKDFFHLSGRIPSEIGSDIELSVNYGSDRKLSLNNAAIYKASDFINSFICVTFIPEDMQLIQGAPVLRRRFLDIAISQISPEYLKHLQSYAIALKSRNAMLRDTSKYSKTTVTAYDVMLAKEGAYIEKARMDFTAILNNSLEKISSELIEDGKSLSVKYMVRLGGFMLQDKSDIDNVETIEKTLLANLDRNYEKDVEHKVTSIGPHRSDFSALLDNVSMGIYSSQGECRIASLALKLACFDVIRDKCGIESVTLLIDDVTGELDSRRRENFFRAIDGVGQILFACTSVPEGLRKPDRLFLVKGGNCTVQ